MSEKLYIGKKLIGLPKHILAALEALDYSDGKNPFASLASVTSIVGFPSYDTSHNQMIQPVVGLRRGLLIKGDSYIKLDIPNQPGEHFVWSLREDMLISNAESLLDTGSTFAVGKDYFVYLVLGTDNNSASLSVSLNTTAPTGATTENSRKIGGFHTLCVSKGTNTTYVRGGQTINHELNGWLAGDILPLSLWDLKHRPRQDKTPQPGMTYERYLGFWLDIYGQSGNGLNTMSAYQGTLTRSRQYVDNVEDMFCVGKILLNDEEFAAAAIGSPEQVAVNGASATAATNGGAGGRSATNGQRMISYCGAEEMCGSLWQFLRTTAGTGAGSSFGQLANGTQGWFNASSAVGDNGPFSQMGSKGSFYALCTAMLAGGVYVVGTDCGSRSRQANSARSSGNADIGSRGRARGAE